MLLNKRMKTVLKINAFQAGALIAGLFLVFSLIFQITNEYYHKRFRMVIPQEEPYVHRGDEKPHLEFRAGQTIHVHYRAKFDRTCERLVNQMRLLKYDVYPEDGVTADTDLVYAWAPYYNSIVKTGIYDYSELLVLPPQLPEGGYVVRRYSFLDCEGYRWTEIYPDAKVKIVP